MRARGGNPPDNQEEMALLPPDAAMARTTIRGQKTHINYFNINSVAPSQNTQFWASNQMFMCLNSWERTPKVTLINLFGGIFVSKQGPKQQAPK